MKELIINVDGGHDLFQYYQWAFSTPTKVTWINSTSVYAGNNQSTPICPATASTIRRIVMTASKDRNWILISTAFSLQSPGVGYAGSPHQSGSPSDTHRQELPAPTPTRQNSEGC